MELTHNHKQQATFTRLRTHYKRSLLSFISQHSGVFEALSRGGSPYGGNWLPANRRTATRKSINSIREKMGNIQQQLNELNSQLTLLSNEMSDIQRSSEHGPTALKHARSISQPSEVGINRFRAISEN